MIIKILKDLDKEFLYLLELAVQYIEEGDVPNSFSEFSKKGEEIT